MIHDKNRTHPLHAHSSPRGNWEQTIPGKSKRNQVNDFQVARRIPRYAGVFGSS